MSPRGGARPGAGRPKGRSPRLSLSVPEATIARLLAEAERRGLPLARIAREHLQEPRDSEPRDPKQGGRPLDTP